MRVDNKPGKVVAIEEEELQAPAKQEGTIDTAAARSTSTQSPGEGVEHEKVEASDAFVDVPFYDKEKDEYGVKKVPLSEFNAGNMTDREIELSDSNALDTKAYDQNFHYYWVHRDAAHPSQNEARLKQYAPVRKAENYAHHIRKIEGLGECVSMGDLALFRVPQDIYEAYEKKRLAMQEARHAEVRNEPRQRIDNFLDGERVYIRNESYNRPYERDEVEGTLRAADEDRVTREIDSLQKAQEYAGTKATFGGFQGPFGSGVPASPINRRK